MERNDIEELFPEATPREIELLLDRERNRQERWRNECAVRIYVLALWQVARRRWARSMPYAKYLRTRHWHAMRRAVIQERGHRCECCGTTQQLHVHHITYDRLGAEYRSDLELLCRGCHAAAHGLPHPDSIGAVIHEIFAGPQGDHIFKNFDLPGPDPRDRGAWRLPEDAGAVDDLW